MLYILFLFILFRFILSFSSIPLHIISSLILYHAEFIHLNILCLFVFFFIIVCNLSIARLALDCQLVQELLI